MVRAHGELAQPSRPDSTVPFSMSSSNRLSLAPAWVTVKVHPPMLSVPVRAVGLGLAATE